MGNPFSRYRQHVVLCEQYILNLLGMLEAVMPFSRNDVVAPYRAGSSGVKIWMPSTSRTRETQ